MAARRILAVTAQVAVSAGLLLWMFSRIEPAAVGGQIVRAGVPAFAAATVALFLIGLPMAWRWRRIVAALGHAMRLRTALRLTLMNLFWFQALPSFLLADLIKGWGVRRTGLSLTQTALSILIDRLSGAFSLALLCAPALPLLLWRTGWSLATGTAALAAAGAAAALALLLAAPGLLPPSAAAWASTFRRLAADGRLMAFVLAQSILGVLLVVAATAILARGMGAALSIVDFVAVLPPILLVTMFRVSFGGWGVREGAMVLGLGMVGVSAEGALALSVLLGLALMLAGMLSGAAGVALGLAEGRGGALAR